MRIYVFILVSEYIVTEWTIKWLETECRNTETTVTTLANHKQHRQSSEAIKKLQANTRSPRKTREKVCQRDTIAFGLLTDCMTKWRKFFKLANRFGDTQVINEKWMQWQSFQKSLSNVLPRFF